MELHAKEQIETAILDWLDGDRVAPASLHDSGKFIVRWENRDGMQLVTRISISESLTNDIDVMIDSNLDEQFAAALDLIEDHVRVLADRHYSDDQAEWKLSEAILQGQCS